ncbi:hypothetical protein P3T76_013610 [Phytophthora citrophthora]|uniref:Uncharacterized protein n=1 Tax=Phytophthora citrophthora TaxID=4793 RepID=A0AAD9G2P7_9STRA|nr:hypothetical protein P3T76_013610 [Phytophthora citrophthora]
MPKRSSVPGSQAPQLSKPTGSKDAELPRPVRPSRLKSSSSSSFCDLQAKFSPKSIDEGNNGTLNSLHTSSRESEPATDEESQLEIGSEFADHHTQLETAECQAVAMLNEITRKSERNHQKFVIRFILARYNAIRDNISGKDKRIEELHTSFEDLACQTASLEVLCNSDVDADTLDKLFMAIPIQQRLLFHD